MYKRRKGKWRRYFSLNTVRGKIMLLTKAVAFAVIGLYLLSGQLEWMNSSLLFVGAVILLTLITDLILEYIITIPLDQLHQSAAKMSKLNLDEKCHLTSNDEFAHLADDMNNLAENLKSALIQQKQISHTLAHELKTPLGIIRAYSEALQDADSSEQKAVCADVIIDETKKMSHLIQTLLDMSALESGAQTLTRAHFDFIEMAETCAGRLLIDQKEPHYYLDASLPSQPCMIYADRHRLEQVIANFCTNAQKYVKKEGRIYLEIKENQNKLTFALYNDLEKSDQIETARIWTPFYRGQNTARKDGAGLGLAISARILDSHGYQYSVSREPEGITFRFEMPCNNSC